MKFIKRMLLLNILFFIFGAILNAGYKHDIKLKFTNEVTNLMNKINIFISSYDKETKSNTSEFSNVRKNIWSSYNAIYKTSNKLLDD